MWLSTPPTNPGDYTASTERNPEALRRWTGRRWSAPWYRNDPECHAAQARATPARTEGALIEWLDHAAH